jgi:hypothetical protein
MAAAVSATSILRFVSVCCGAGSCGVLGIAVAPRGPGGAVLEACGCEGLPGTAVNASGLAGGLVSCATIAGAEVEGRPS